MMVHFAACALSKSCKEFSDAKEVNKDIIKKIKIIRPKKERRIKIKSKTEKRSEKRMYKLTLNKKYIDDVTLKLKGEIEQIEERTTYHYRRLISYELWAIPL